MINFVKSFKSLIKLEQIHTDNHIFKLHYKFTVIMLIVFSILLTSKQYFGDPIKCDSNKSEISKEVLDLFCWIIGSFTLKKTLRQSVLPGLGNDPSIYMRELNKQANPDDIIWHKYYQWVCIVFCFQALFFYLPRYLWKTWEGGRLRLLISEFSGPLVTPSWNNLTKHKLISYIVSGKYTHNIYALRYLFCEILNLVNVIAQLFFMDWFLTGQFSFYGLAVFYGDINPMDSVFPKTAKCLFYKFGPSGDIVSRDALCILPLNVLNEKLFLILWFWLYILLILSVVAVIYRVAVLMSTRVRAYLLMAQNKNLGFKKSRMIVNEISFGDFFLVYNIGKNVNPVINKELVWGIHEYVKKNKCYRYPNDV